MWIRALVCLALWVISVVNYFPVYLILAFFAAALATLSSALVLTPAESYRRWARHLLGHQPEEPELSVPRFYPQ